MKFQSKTKHSIQKKSSKAQKRLERCSKKYWIIQPSPPQKKQQKNKTKTFSTLIIKVLQANKLRYNSPISFYVYRNYEVCQRLGCLFT